VAQRLQQAFWFSTRKKMNSTSVIRLLCKTSVLALSSLTFIYANAQSTGRASEQVSVGTMSILVSPTWSIQGSADGNPLAGSALAGTGSVYVIGGIINGAKDSVEIILDATSGAGKVSVTLGRSAFEKAGISVGTTVQAVAESTGTLLIASGKLLAFIPNSVGEALLYNSRVAGANAQ
jgi:hypothetical protein